MLFNTMQYFVFLPIAVFGYYILPQRVRYIWLLIVSYYFYMQWNPLYVILLFLCTFLTYICGRIIGSLKELETNCSLAGSEQICVWGGGIRKTNIYALPYVFYVIWVFLGILNILHWVLVISTVCFV